MPTDRTPRSSSPRSPDRCKGPKSSPAVRHRGPRGGRAPTALHRAARRDALIRPIPSKRKVAAGGRRRIRGGKPVMGNGDSRVRGIAARAGGWSARHRWAAVGIWVLFVVLAMGLGSAAGRVDVKESEQLKGETHTAAKIIEDAGIEEPASETVLVQAKDAGTRATDADVR